jgi:hypothetical protein
MIRTMKGVLLVRQKNFPSCRIKRMNGMNIMNGMSEARNLYKNHGGGRIARQEMFLIKNREARNVPYKESRGKKY